MRIIQYAYVQSKTIQMGRSMPLLESYVVNMADFVVGSVAPPSVSRIFAKTVFLLNFSGYFASNSFKTLVMSPLVDPRHKMSDGLLSLRKSTASPGVMELTLQSGLTPVIFFSQTRPSASAKSDERRKQFVNSISICGPRKSLMNDGTFSVVLS